jgi:thiamine pyrophosphokinase
MTSRPENLRRYKNILLGIGGTDRLPPPEKKWHLIVAADGGGEFLFHRNMPADLLIGDFDSISPEAERFHEAAGARLIRFPRNKDFSDLELALQEIAGEQPAHVHVVGLSGGRRDHELMNLFVFTRYLTGKLVTFDFPEAAGGILEAGRLRIIHRHPGARASLLALTPTVTGICSAGVEWELTEATLGFGESRGISNATVGAVWELHCREGALLWLMDGTAHAELEIEWLPGWPGTPD